MGSSGRALRRPSCDVSQVAVPLNLHYTSGSLGWESLTVLFRDLSPRSDSPSDLGVTRRFYTSRGLAGKPRSASRAQFRVGLWPSAPARPS